MERPGIDTAIIKLEDNKDPTWTGVIEWNGIQMESRFRVYCGSKKKKKRKKAACGEE